DGSTTDFTGSLGYHPTGRAGGRARFGRCARAADCHLGGEGQQEFNQLLQATVLGSSFGQAATSRSSLGQETGRATRSPPSCSRLGSTRTTSPGDQVQAARVQEVRSRPPR